MFVKIQPSRTMPALTQRNGFSLVEVLVSVLILALCLVSVAGMILFSHKANTSSFIKQQAIQSAYDVIDLMRANRDSSNSYVMSNLGGAAPAAPATDCSANTCTSAQTAAWDLYNWQTRMAQYGGSGQIVVAPGVGVPNLPDHQFFKVDVTVQWDDTQAEAMLGNNSAQGASANLEQIVVSSQI